MACRRSISTKAILFSRRFHPSFSHILHPNKDDDANSDSPKSILSQPTITEISPYVNHNPAVGFGSRFREKMCSSRTQQMGLGFSNRRYISSTIGEGSDRISDIGFVAEVAADKGFEVVTYQAPAVSEVAVAAADSSLPVASLQYLIDAVHSFTGLNWWASIALTTLLIRGATIPLLIDQLKATAKLNLIRPHLEMLRQEMQANAQDPKALEDGQKKVKALFNEYGVTPFTPMKGLLIQGPIFISFFLAIRNMAEKVPSFQNGGALWFVDLTTPDNLGILPVLTALTFWITVECNMQEGLEGNPIAGTMKNFSRILAVVSVPVMMSFPKALFCYWLTSNLVSLVYGIVMRRPEVKSFLRLPQIPDSSSVTLQSQLSTFSSLNQDPTAVKSEPPSPNESLKVADRRISSSSVMNQRLKTLERLLKRRNKNKKVSRGS